MKNAWPPIPYEPWRETLGALHLFTQIVGKYRLANTPWLNHSWHATFYVSARGLTTSLVPDAGMGVEIEFDLIDHELRGATSTGGRAAFALEPMTVAAFQGRFLALLDELGANPRFNGSPNEIPDALPFAEDDRPRPYDREAVTRFFLALVQIDRVFKQFRTGFLGKASPVHLFWGSFDLAVTRFSGAVAPLHPGGVPALPDEITHEAYSHQVSSAGFWPGGGGVDFPAFYSYAYPAPDGFPEGKVAPDEAYFDAKLGEFILPYDAVREAEDPDAMLTAFLQSTYELAAKLGDWRRNVLECAPGEPCRPRPM